MLNKYENGNKMINIKTKKGKKLLIYFILKFDLQSFWKNSKMKDISGPAFIPINLIKKRMLQLYGHSLAGAILAGPVANGE